MSSNSNQIQDGELTVLEGSSNSLIAGMGKVLNLKVDIKLLNKKSEVLNLYLGLNSVMSSSKGSNIHHNHVPLSGYLTVLLTYEFHR